MVLERACAQEGAEEKGGERGGAQEYPVNAVFLQRLLLGYVIQSQQNSGTYGKCEPHRFVSLKNQESKILN